MPGLCLDEDERAVGERGVVAPDGEQFTLGVDLGLVQVGDAACDQPGGDCLGGAFERGLFGFGDLSAGDEPLLVVVPDRLRVLDLHPRVGRDRINRATNLRVGAHSALVAPLLDLRPANVTQ